MVIKKQTIIPINNTTLTPRNACSHGNTKNNISNTIPTIKEDIDTLYSVSIITVILQ